MELIRGTYNSLSKGLASVVTIGNFDGLHLGHQALLDDVSQTAKRLGLVTTVVIFEPQPQEFFSLDKSPPRLMRWREKFTGLQQLGIERLVMMRFNGRFSQLSPEFFVRNILVEGLGMRHLIIGDDFRFGKARQGDINLLNDMGTELGFTVSCAETHFLAGQRISSTWLRNALANGDCSAAMQLLGKPYAMSGRVVHGMKRGRELGFPTVNINLHRNKSPLRGIFACNVRGLSKVYEAVAYIGNRPALNGTHDVLEAHLFDFNGDCYGKNLQIDFIVKLRDDEDFASIESLRQQIHSDIEQAKIALREFNRPI